MPIRERLTKRVVEAVLPPQEGSVLVFDSEVKGFGVRVRRGRGGDSRIFRTYVFRYQEGYGRKASRDRWLKIGEHGEPWSHAQTGRAQVLTTEAARAMASWLRGIRNGGGDPRAALRPAEVVRPRSACPTLREFAQVYLAKHADVHKSLRSAKEDRRMLEHDILPALGDLALDELTHENVSDFHVSMASGPVTGNRVLSLLSAILSLALRRGALPPGHVNPCAGVKRFPQHPRDRYLSPHELVAVGKALAAAERSSPMAVAAIRVLAFTGARPREIYTLKRDQLRLDQKHVMIQRKGRWLPLYLHQPAVDILAAIPERPRNPYVFPSLMPNHERHHLHPNTIGLVWQQVRLKAECPDVRLYDLRHTFASVAVQDGASLPIIGALLGHSQSSTTQRYAHLAESPVRKVGNRTAEKIAKALKGG
jgi:integrase